MGILMLRKYLCLTAIVFFSASSPATAQPADSLGKTVLIRCDDMGMCHSVNMAIQRILETGMPVSVSVMFACPWYQEAVEILKHYPKVSTGIHLTLNSEWKNYRWGPIAGRSVVPSLVDSLGYFFPSRSALAANRPRIDEIEKELRAQIERAIQSGLRIDYVDYHMGAAVETPERRLLVERLAREYRLAMSRYFGEIDVDGVYSAPPASKLDTLLKRAADLPAATINLMVFHTGLQGPEMDALEDLNPFGLREMSKHREAEMKALVSPEFRSLIGLKHVNLITYHDIIRTTGLQSMKRPAE